MNMITLTEKAISKLRDHLSKDPDSIGVKMGVQGGGCSGFQYTFSIISEEDPDDRKFEQSGVAVYIDKKSYIFLINTEIDYVEDLMGSGFKFNNPSANRTCGCGESFGV